jgi:hypothetical protein
VVSVAMEEAVGKMGKRIVRDDSIFGRRLDLLPIALQRISKFLAFISSRTDPGSWCVRIGRSSDCRLDYRIREGILDGCDEATDLVAHGFRSNTHGRSLDVNVDRTSDASVMGYERRRGHCADWPPKSVDASI